MNLSFWIILLISLCNLGVISFYKSIFHFTILQHGTRNRFTIPSKQNRFNRPYVHTNMNIVDAWSRWGHSHSMNESTALHLYINQVKVSTNLSPNSTTNSRSELRIVQNDDTDVEDEDDVVLESNDEIPETDSETDLQSKEILDYICYNKTSNLESQPYISSPAKDDSINTDNMLISNHHKLNNSTDSKTRILNRNPSPIFNFTNKFSSSFNRKTTINLNNLNDISMKTSKHGKSKKTNMFNQPTHTCKNIAYDYLAPDSLSGIEAPPQLKFEKGVPYLKRWWESAKKWELLCEELKALDELFADPDSTSGPGAAGVTENFSLKTAYDEEGEGEGAGEDGLDEEVGDEYEDDTSEESDTADQGRTGVSTKDSVRDTFSDSQQRPFLRSDNPSGSSSFRDASDATTPPSETIQDRRRQSSYCVSSMAADTNHGGFSSYLSHRSNNDGKVERLSDENLNGREATQEDDDQFHKQDIRKVSSLSSQGSPMPMSQKSMKETTSNTKTSVVPVNALIEYCQDRRARVIAVGDVHGCVDELCDLLREVKYSPGDVVVFVGDLVAKGPASLEVIRLAIDIGALSVRGNHDHEVTRQGVINRSKIKSRRKLAKMNSEVPSSASSGSEFNTNEENSEPEHLRIAFDLNAREYKWLSELPYYIRSIDLGVLFVHAGFQHNVRLADQEPWVMMTMRSILPDGKISPRCFHKYPWAEKWTGPLTVVFGHDAARGLQVYNNAIGLDTGCVYGGRLTALLLPEKELVSVPARKAYQDYGKSKSHKLYSLATDGSPVSTRIQNLPESPVDVSLNRRDENNNKRRFPKSREHSSVMANITGHGTEARSS